MTTYHVSLVVGGSLTGPPTPFYARVTASSPGNAIDQAETLAKRQGLPVDGEWRCQEAEPSELRRAA